MNVGIPNPNAFLPLAKMCITNQSTKKKIYVMIDLF